MKTTGSTQDKLAELASETIRWFGFEDELQKRAGTVEVEHSFHPVVVQPPQAKRPEFPFVGFIDFQGLKIDVENKKGDYRRGKDGKGVEWKCLMHAHYGEIRDTEGTDGDKLDVYVGPNHDSSLVVVVRQHKPDTGAFDEDKVMVGFDSVEEAIGAYKKQYDRPGFYKDGDHLAMPIGRFWRWVHDRDNHGKKVAAVKLASPILDAAHHFFASPEALAASAGVAKAHLLGRYGHQIPGLRTVLKPYFEGAAHAGLQAGLHGEKGLHPVTKGLLSALDPHSVGHYEHAMALGKTLNMAGVRQPTAEHVRAATSKARELGLHVPAELTSHLENAVSSSRPANRIARALTKPIDVSAGMSAVRRAASSPGPRPGVALKLGSLPGVPAPGARVVELHPVAKGVLGGAAALGGVTAGYKYHRREKAKELETGAPSTGRHAVEGAAAGAAAGGVLGAGAAQGTRNVLTNVRSEFAPHAKSVGEMAQCLHADGRSMDQIKTFFKNPGFAHQVQGAQIAHGAHTLLKKIHVGKAGLAGAAGLGLAGAVGAGIHAHHNKDELRSDIRADQRRLKVGPYAPPKEASAATRTINGILPVGDALSARARIQKTAPPQHAPPKPLVQVAPSPWSKGAGVLFKMAAELPGVGDQGERPKVVGMKTPRLATPRLNPDQGKHIPTNPFRGNWQKMGSSRLRKAMQVVDTGSHGLKAYAMRLHGKEIGHMTTTPRGVIVETNIDPKYRGLGLGKKLYGEVMRRMPNQELHSGGQVSESAQRVWAGLEKNKSYEIQKAPGILKDYGTRKVLEIDPGNPQQLFKGRLPPAAAIKMGSSAETILHEAGEVAHKLTAALPTKVKHGLLGAAAVGAGAWGLKETADQMVNPRPEGVGLGAGARAGQKVLTLGLSRAGSGPVQY